ncbi:KRAB-A domain-containing protein 2-like [Onthophagus taurus]|uniref:KRAB-A domain-containing protein 2-like n=1 Tax=Onthophagus taurus TaxID=166361 RepID=UPI0039BDAA7D
MEPMKYFLPAEEIYDIIDAAHISIGHGGRDRLKNETAKKYANVTKEMINIYLSMCEVCQRKKSKSKQGLVLKPILHTEMNSRCQVDLIDMQSQADREYKFIMVYQDHLTKFVVLRSLKTKRATDVTHHLLDIFLTFGAPCILHSDNGREFVNSVLKELASYWSELKLVNGKPRHSQSQGSVERAKKDVENMLASWMHDNKRTNWSKGLRYVQFMKNRAFHSGIKQSPYRTMFRSEPKVGLMTSNLPLEVIKFEENESGEENDEYYKEDEGNKIEKEGEIAEVEKDQERATPCTSDELLIRTARKDAHYNLAKQSERMKKSSDQSHPPLNVGDNVTIPVPDVDRGKAELRNIIGIVLEVSSEQQYKIGTRDGILDKLYCRLEFGGCSEKFIRRDEVPNVTITLRTAARKASIGTGQGYVRCVCFKGCTNNKCLCKKNDYYLILSAIIV